MPTDLLSYYAQPGPFTRINPDDDMLTGLPASATELVKVVQGNLLHVFWAKRYGVEHTEEQQQALQIRDVPSKLNRMRAVDASPLAVARPVEVRQVGNCRDFSTLLVALLRRIGIPARARAGFATYFLPDHFEDHWVCEYWNAGQSRWVMVDAQLDEFQQGALQVDFDVFDVPHDRFIVGGKAWQMCRTGGADPDKFGIFDMRGLDFIRGDLFRDFLALNKVEILPWDFGWGLLAEGADADREAYDALFDRLAALTLAGDSAFPEVRATYQNEPGLWATEEWLAKVLPAAA